MTPIRIGLIGAGVIGRAHAAILAKLPPDQAQFVAIADPSEAGAALAHSLGVQHFADAEAMLDGAQPDAAIIATPNVLHGPNAHDCIGRGVAVLVEKPLADDVATTHAIAEHAERTGVKLLVGHFRRHNPVLQAARRIIQDGRLGRLVAIAASSTVLKPDPYFDVAWRRQPGGGPILINLVHDIDALRFLCGEIDTVQALVANEARGLPVEDTAAVLLRFRSGALATIMLSDATPSPFCWDQTAGENPTFPTHQADAYRISGTEGTLELPSLTLWRYPGQRGWDQRLVRETNAVEGRDPLEQQTLHFLRVIRGEEAPLVSGWDGARTVAATLAVGRSATERMAVRPEELTGGVE